MKNDMIIVMALSYYMMACIMKVVAFKAMLITMIM